jgi:hypothetical protein
MAGISGKGISAAVRGAIGEWMTERTVAALFKEYETSTKGGSLLSEWAFSRRIREADEWVRIVRRRSSIGWVREYHSKNFPNKNVQLEVITNNADTEIQYVTVKINRKIIGGGKVRVPSLLESQNGRKAALKLELAFDPFSEAQLAEMQAQMEFGEDAVYTMLFADRVV